MLEHAGADHDGHDCGSRRNPGRGSQLLEPPGLAAGINRAKQGRPGDFLEPGGHSLQQGQGQDVDRTISGRPGQVLVLVRRDPQQQLSRKDAADRHVDVDQACLLLRPDRWRHRGPRGLGPPRACAGQGRAGYGRQRHLGIDDAGQHGEDPVQATAVRQFDSHRVTGLIGPPQLGHRVTDQHRIDGLRDSDERHHPAKFDQRKAGCFGGRHH